MNRAFLRCRICNLVFVDTIYHLSASAEKKRYETHENIPFDVRYLKHLSRLIDPVVGLLSPGSHGIDFGCGPGPAVSRIMSSKGFSVENYDPFFADDKTLLCRIYDFLISTEVIEHLRYPSEEFRLIKSIVKKGGIIGIMTNFSDGKDLSDWFYTRDPTHIAFYSQKTFYWIAKRFKLDIETIKDPLAIFRNR
jgi:2-polyprenyl-3-methyl-5-hydroxy-6-metoxy-1,4-benzoquinol methylase